MWSAKGKMWVIMVELHEERKSQQMCKFVGV